MIQMHNENSQLENSQLENSQLENSKLKNMIWKISFIQNKWEFNGTGFTAKSKYDGQPEYIIVTVAHNILKVLAQSSQIQSSQYQQDSSPSRQNERNEIPSQSSRQDRQQSSSQIERNQIPSAQLIRNDNKSSSSQIQLNQLPSDQPNSQDNQSSSSSIKLNQIPSGQPNSQDQSSSYEIKLMNHIKFSIKQTQFIINQRYKVLIGQQKSQNNRFLLEELMNDYSFINKQHLNQEIYKLIYSSGGFELPKQNLTYKGLNFNLGQTKSELFLIGYNKNNQQTTMYKLRLLTQQEICPSLQKYSEYFFFYRVIQRNMCLRGVSGGPVYYNSQNPCAIAIHIGVKDDVQKMSGEKIYWGLKISQQTFKQTINMNKKDSPSSAILNQVEPQDKINKIKIQDKDYQQSQENNGQMQKQINNLMKKQIQIMQNIQQDLLQQPQQNDETDAPIIVYKQQFKNCFFQKQKICFEKHNRQWKREIQIKIYQNTQNKKPKHILQYQFYCGMKKAIVKHFRLPLGHQPEQKILRSDSPNILISFRQQITCNKTTAPQQTFILKSNPFIIFEDNNNKQIPYQIQLGNGEITIQIKAQITLI